MFISKGNESCYDGTWVWMFEFGNTWVYDMKWVGFVFGVVAFIRKNMIFIKKTYKFYCEFMGNGKWGKW